MTLNRPSRLESILNDPYPTARLALNLMYVLIACACMVVGALLCAGCQPAADPAPAATVAHPAAVEKTAPKPFPAGAPEAHPGEHMVGVRVVP